MMLMYIQNFILYTHSNAVLSPVPHTTHAAPQNIVVIIYVKKSTRDILYYTYIYVAHFYFTYSNICSFTHIYTIQMHLYIFDFLYSERTIEARGLYG